MYFFFHKFNVWILICLLLLFAEQTSAEVIDLQSCLGKAQTPLATMECFRGLPYRIDGVLDEQDRWTTWADQSKDFITPGLNCSGLTIAISRSIWGQNLSLDEAKHDRRDDSGFGAPMGEDWDFGLDLILNLTEGLPRQLIPNPYQDQNLDSRLWSAVDLRGVDIDTAEFVSLLAQIQPEKIYYFAVSKSDAKFAGGISFYHVGLILKNGPNIWLYHATPKGGVYRVNLAGEAGVAWFRKYYGASSRGPRYIQFIEVPLTDSVHK